MIVNKELVVSNRKKADTIDKLCQKKFQPFPNAAKAKAAGETDYDYPLGMAIWSPTKEKVRVPH